MADMDTLLKGLAIQKQRIAMVDEMARRINLDKSQARRILAQEIVMAEREKREVDMTAVARAIWALKGV